MSLIVGSRSSGSSGPSPNTSSISSPNSTSRSPRLSGVLSSASSSPTSVRISLSARARSACASASRFRRLSSFRWTFAFSSTYCGARGGLRRAAGDRRRGRRRTGWRGWRCDQMLMAGYQMDAMRSRPSRLLLRRGWRRRARRSDRARCRVNWSNCVAMSELPASASGTPELSAVDTVL